MPLLATRPWPTAAVLVLIAALAAPGCSTTGDFGRQNTGLIEGKVLPVARHMAASLRGIAVSDYPLTRDETELRARGEAIVAAERGFSPSRVIGSMIESAGLAESRYQERRRLAHNTGRAAQDTGLPSRRRDVLAHLVDSEREEFRAFAIVAHKVYQADEARRRALGDGLDLSFSDVRNTIGRIRENRRVVERTIAAMKNRIDDYRLELRRSTVEHPDASGRAATAIDRMADDVDRVEQRLRAWVFPEDRLAGPRRPGSRPGGPALMGG